MQWLPGHKLKNRPYEIERELGQGGFGITYKARDLTLDIPVVIKTPNSKLQRDGNYEKYVENFTREAKQLAQLGLNPHPHIVRVSTLFKEGDLPCIVMDFIPGQSLYDLVWTQGKLSETKAVEYIKQIGSALSVCHSAGIVHRDVHPNNILIHADNGKAVLIDFGISGTTQTSRNTHSGNRAFAPWEQVAYWEQENSKTPQVDIYTLAASLYFLVTGQEPTECLARKYNNRELIEPKQLNSELSDEINQAILKGVEVYPENRPSLMQEWLNLLSFAPFKQNNQALDSRRLIENRNVQDDKQVNEVLRERNYAEEGLGANRQVAKNDDQEEKPSVVEPFATTPNVVKKNENIKQKVNLYLSRESDSTTNKKIGIYFFCSVIMLVVAGYVSQNWNNIVASLIGIEPDRYLYPEEQDINEIDFLPNSQKIAIAGGDKVEFWNIENLQKSPDSINTSMVSSLSANPDIDASTSTVLATGSLNKVELWDRQLNRVAVLTGHTERITEVVFSPDGETLASGSADETVKLWNMKTQEEITTIKNVGYVTELEYSPDGQTLAIGNENSTVRLWNIKSEKEIFSTYYGSFSNGLVFSPDGQILAVSDISESRDKSVKLFNLRTHNSKIADLNQGRSTVNDVEALAFSPDGKIVAVGTKSLIKLWDFKTNKVVNTLKSSSLEVNSLSFSPDGKTLASVGDKSIIELWNFPIK